MNWLHWWIPEFIILFVLLVFLAPIAGAFFLKELKIKIENAFWRGHLEFILGFCLVYLAGSLLTPLRHAGLIVLVGSLCYLKFYKKADSSFKLSFWDLITVPTIIAALYYPVAIDSNLQKLQFSFFNDFWPLDSGARLDVHTSLSLLLGFWFKNTPLINLLSVQGPFFALLIWRGLIFCWELIKDRKIKNYELALLAAIYGGSLYYRKQIEVKASPIGGFFAVLSLILLTKEVSPLILGFFIAAAFNFGEYGGIVLAPALLLCVLQKGPLAKRALSSVPWIVLFSAPEIIRKSFITSNHNYVALVGAAAFCYLLFKNSDKLTKPLEKIAVVKSLFPILVTVFFATLVFTLLFPMPQFDDGSASVWHWSLGCNGVAFLVSAYYIWKTKNTHLKTTFVSLAIVQLCFLLFWHVHDHFDLPACLDPTSLWWNLSKNAMMIIWPLSTSILAAVFFAEKFEGKKSKASYAMRVLLIAYFVFLQDPLVRNVSHGPFAPHGPRYSVLRNLNEMHWQTVHIPSINPPSGNLVLAHRAMPEPQMVEELFRRQKIVKEPITLCFDSEKFKNFDIDAYTVGYFAGVVALPNKQGCLWYIVTPIEACTGTDKAVYEGKAGRLCAVADVF